MGYSQTWAAVKGASLDAVHTALELRPTGAHEEFAESNITGVQLPGGWYVVVANHEVLLNEEPLLVRLSKLGEVVMCFVEEHVMCSSAAFWRDGQCLWSISHAADNGIENLVVKGEPPPAFIAIRDRLRSQQAAAGGNKAEVDYIFDIPVELAESLTGYRHDKDIPGLPKDAFEVLQTIRKQSKLLSWLRSNLK